MSTFYANSINLQINDSVRLTFMDQRDGVPPVDHGPIVIKVAEVVMSLPNARQLRDLLVLYIKDEPSAETVQ